MTSLQTLIGTVAALAALSAAAQSANVPVTFVGTAGTGTMATCELSVKAQNKMDRKLLALVVEYQALDAASGKPLAGGLNSATVGGLAPGGNTEQPVGTVHAACERVRLQVTKTQCVTRGCQPGFAQQGLAGLQP